MAALRLWPLNLADVHVAAWRMALAEGFLDRQININIAANTPSEDALIEWGAAARLSIMISTAPVHGGVAPAVRGHLTARAALTALKDSGLSYFESEGNIRVVSSARRVRSDLTPKRTGHPGASPPITKPAPTASHLVILQQQTEGVTSTRSSSPPRNEKRDSKTYRHRYLRSAVSNWILYRSILCRTLQTTSRDCR